MEIKFQLEDERSLVNNLAGPLSDFSVAGDALAVIGALLPSFLLHCNLTVVQLHTH